MAKAEFFWEAILTILTASWLTVSLMMFLAPAPNLEIAFLIPLTYLHFLGYLCWIASALALKAKALTKPLTGILVPSESVRLA